MFLGSERFPSKQLCRDSNTGVWEEPQGAAGSLAQTTIEACALIMSCMSSRAESSQHSKALEDYQQQPFQLVMGKGPDGRSIPLGVISTQGQVHFPECTWISHLACSVYEKQRL